jgi:hypothetical protein
MASRYDHLSREQLIQVVRELLMDGQFIDRAGMPWAIIKLGHEAMASVAIEEWMGASPLYTRRMQKAMNFVGDDVPTIFKGLQLDCGAPQHFLDFTFSIRDAEYGEFWLPYCGALADVEPMGEATVKLMCHDIEDPTFDATAVATNPRARMRPFHRPPRSPVDRSPVCHWSVEIDHDAEPLVEQQPTLDMRKMRIVDLDLDPVDPNDEGLADYSGPLLSEVPVLDFSASALRRIADEVCIHLNLLNLSFTRTIRNRLDRAEADEVCTEQLTGFAFIAAERMAKALEIPATPAGALDLLELLPFFNPAAYVDLTREGDALHVRHSIAHDDDGWLARIGPGRTAPLEAAVAALDPMLSVEVTGEDEDWTLRVVPREPAYEQPGAVQMTLLSQGRGFSFDPNRRALPLTPV